MIIYKITNKITGKVYIGQTTQLLAGRIHNYKMEYKWEKNPRPIICSMRKHGFENFTFEIIDSADTKEELDKLERYYITQYKSLVTQNGYNVELGGNGIGKHSPETKRKIGAAQLGEKNHMYGKIGELNPTSKRVIDLTSGKIYGAASDIARELGKDVSKICAVCRGDRGSAYNRIFRYLDDNGNIIPVKNHPPIKKASVIQNILPEYKEYI